MRNAAHGMLLAALTAAAAGVHIQTTACNTSSSDAADPFCGGRILLLAPVDQAFNYSVGDRALLVTMAQQVRRRCPHGRVEIVGQPPGPHREIGYCTSHEKEIKDPSTVSAVFVAGADVLDGRYGCCLTIFTYIKEAMRLRVPLSIISFSYDVDFRRFGSRIAPGTCLRPRSAPSCHRIARMRDMPEAGTPSRLSQVVETADIVFLLKPKLISRLPLRMLEDLAWVEQQRLGTVGRRQRVVLGINLLFYKPPAPLRVLAKRASHALCDASKLSGGRTSFLFVPHDFRASRVQRAAAPPMSPEWAKELGGATAEPARQAESGYANEAAWHAEILRRMGALCPDVTLLSRHEQ